MTTASTNFQYILCILHMHKHEAWAWARAVKQKVNSIFISDADDDDELIQTNGIPHLIAPTMQATLSIEKDVQKNGWNLQFSYFCYRFFLSLLHFLPIFLFVFIASFMASIFSHPTLPLLLYFVCVPMVFHSNMNWIHICVHENEKQHTKKALQSLRRFLEVISLNSVASDLFNFSLNSSFFLRYFLKALGGRLDIFWKNSFYQTTGSKTEESHPYCSFPLAFQNIF